MTLRERLIAVADWLQRIQLWLAALALMILMMVTVADVLLTYVFNGMAATFFGRRHIVIDLIDSFVGPRATVVLVRIADALSVVCIGLLMWAMRVPAMQAYDYGDIKLELHLPIWVLWAVAFAALAGTIFCAIVALVARPATTDVGHA